MFLAPEELGWVFRRASPLAGLPSCGFSRLPNQAVRVFLTAVFVGLKLAFPASLIQSSLKGFLTLPLNSQRTQRRTSPSIGRSGRCSGHPLLSLFELPWRNEVDRARFPPGVFHSVFPCCVPSLSDRFRPLSHHKDADNS